LPIVGLRRWIADVLHPDRYHGAGRRRGPFFEGWYYKLVDASGCHRFAVIPGVFLGAEPATSECFVQVLDGSTGAASYHAWPLARFAAARDAFEVAVADCRFRADGLALRIDDAARPVEGVLRFASLVPWPVTWRAPGVMGWYAWVPFMECYHGVVSLDHAIEGRLRIGERTIDFDGGRGYIEKDWGQAFPSAYVWMQTNHFERPRTSLSASVAMIPWVRRHFRGFLVGLWHDGVLHRFTTYGGATIERLAVTETTVAWVLRSGGLRLALEATRAAGGLLHAPIRTEMHGRVDETLRATVAVELAPVGGGRPLFTGVGRHAGLEVHGDLETLLRA
jgi:tocopherol cyclase